MELLPEFVFGPHSSNKGVFLHFERLLWTVCVTSVDKAVAD